MRITAIREITAHKQAEEALRQSEGRFRSLVEFLPDGLMVVHEGRIVYANATAARLYGAARPELLRGMRMADRVPPDRRDFVAADMARLAHDSTNRPPHDGAILRLDGSRLEVEASAISFRHDGQPAVLTVLRDMTERRGSREAVLAYQRRLRQLATELSLIQARERRELAHYLHDGVGQDLAMTRLQLQMLQRQPLPTDAPELIGKARTLVERAIERTRSLTLGLSPPTLYEIGLVAAVAGLLDEMRQLHGMQVEFVAPSAGFQLKEGPRVLAFRAVRELLLNVAKHAQARHVSVALARTDMQLTMSVADDGVGFDPAAPRRARSSGSSASASRSTASADPCG